MPSKAPGDGTVYANTYSINVSNSGSVFKFDCFLMWLTHKFSPCLTQRCGGEVLFVCFLFCPLDKKSLALWSSLKKTELKKKKAVKSSHLMERLKLAYNVTRIVYRQKAEFIANG